MKALNPKTLLVVSGPTASGKTALAIHLAQHFGTEIISADSRQFYKELPVGTAAPSNEEQSLIKHHFVGNLSVSDSLDVASYETEVLALLQQLFEIHDLVILCGGSGLFIDAVCEGLDAIPDTEDEIRKEVEKIYLEEGLSGLQKRIQEIDPEYFAIADTQNPRRLQRALEVWMQTGETFTSFRKNEPVKRDFRLLPDSPALALGFRPIDMSSVGLYGDAEWTALPQQHPPRPLLATESTLGRQLVVDDFEESAPGQKPAYAALVEAPKEGAYIEISADRASSGKQSLKFVDSAAASIYYYPHLYYSPKLVGNLRLRVSFDLYREPGAMLWTEWRHTPGYAKVGPCLYIEADGRLLFQDKRPSDCILPAGQWLHVEMVDGLGVLADGLWSLKITGADGALLFEQGNLPCDPEFSRVLWLGFVAHGTAPALLYLDNLAMRADESPGK
jgi:hypothetical protein